MQDVVVNGEGNDSEICIYIYIETLISHQTVWVSGTSCYTFAIAADYSTYPGYL